MSVFWKKRSFRLVFFILISFGVTPTYAQKATSHTTKTPPVKGFRDAILLDLNYAKQKITVSRITRCTFDKARKLHRYWGRYIVELYKGRTKLVDFPFNFPLGLNAGENHQENNELNQNIQKHLHAQTRILLPYRSDLTYLAIIERKTKKKRLFYSLKTLHQQKMNTCDAEKRQNNDKYKSPLKMR